MSILWFVHVILKWQQFLKSFVLFYNGTIIINLIFNYFVARSLKRSRYFISSEHCIILWNIVVVRETN